MKKIAAIFLLLIFIAFVLFFKEKPALGWLVLVIDAVFVGAYLLVKTLSWMGVTKRDVLKFSGVTMVTLVLIGGVVYFNMYQDEKEIIALRFKSYQQCLSNNSGGSVCDLVLIGEEYILDISTSSYRGAYKRCLDEATTSPDTAKANCLDRIQSQRMDLIRKAKADYKTWRSSN